MLQKKMNDYHEAVRFIESIGSLTNVNYLEKRYNPKFFLDRTRYLLNLVGNPDTKLKVIHVAGTSGKGSVCDLIQQNLFLSGKKTGIFTSPYVTTSIEKFKVDDKYISVDDFVNIVEYLKPFINKMYIDSPFGAPSYFEICFAISLIYFVQQKCEWAVLETGLGGSFDSTNVVENPVITALTNVGLDHMDVLGKTRSKIARDKAGIAKSGSIFITSEKRPYLVKIIKDIALGKGVSKFISTNHSYDINQQNNELVSLVLESIGIKNYNVTKTSLAGRFDIVSHKPLIILDGAHNDDKISYTLEKIKQLKYKRLITVFAVSDNKDMSKALPKIVNLSDKIFITRFYNDYRQYASPINLFKTMTGINPNLDCIINIDPNDAVEKAIKNANIDDIVLVIGSFFLVGEVRKRWYSEEYILDNQKSF